MKECFDKNFGTKKYMQVTHMEKNKSLIFLSLILLFCFVALPLDAVEQVDVSGRRIASGQVDAATQPSDIEPAAVQQVAAATQVAQADAAAQPKAIEPVSAPQHFLIDQIERVIYGPGFPEAKGLRDTTAIITKSDLERIGLDGAPRTMDKLIFEDLVFLDAKKYNMLDDKLVDRYIDAVRAQNNLSLDDIKKMFHDSGYTYEEGREQLAKFNMINQLLDFKVRSKVIVPEREARAYYDAHPEFEPAAYQVERIFVPVTPGVSREENKKDIQDKVKLGQHIIGSESVDFWINDEDISAEKAFIRALQICGTSEVLSFENGFEVFKLLAKKDQRKVPFEERFRQIVNQLKQPLFQKLFDNYKAELRKQCVVVDLSDPSGSDAASTPEA